MAGVARFNPQSDEAVIANIEANKAAAVPPRQMYDGNGPLSNAVRGFTPPTTEGRPPTTPTPVAYNDNGNGMPWIGDATAATGAAIKGVAGFFADKSATTRPTYGADGKLIAAPVVKLAAPVGGILTPPAQAKAPAATPVNTTTQLDRTPIDWTKAANNAMSSVKGFGYQGPAQDATPTGGATEQYGFASAPGGPTMIGNPANYDKGAMQRLSDKVRVGPEKETVTVDGQLMDRAEWDAKNTRLDAAQKELKLNQKQDEILLGMRDNMPMGTSREELATLADKQLLANSKTKADALAAETTAATNASRIEQENVRGGFGLQAQALRNEGSLASENVRGGFSVRAARAGKELSEEDRNYKIAQTNELNDRPTKTELAKQAAQDKKDLLFQQQRKIVADARAKAITDNAGNPDASIIADSIAAQTEAGLSGRGIIPGKARQKGTFRFGFGKDEVLPTADRLAPDPARLAEMKKRGLV